MHQLMVQLGTMPINIVLLSEGSLAFVRTANFKGIVDQATCENCPAAIFTEQGFTIGEESFEWNTKYLYKEYESLLQWLIAQRLEMPVNNVFGF